MAQAPKQRPDDEVAATRRKLARLLAIGALRAIESERTADNKRRSGHLKTPDVPE